MVGSSVCEKDTKIKIRGQSNYTIREIKLSNALGIPYKKHTHFSLLLSRTLPRTLYQQKLQ